MLGLKGIKAVALVCVWYGMVLTSYSYAKPWDIDIGVNTSISYSDNIYKASDNKKSDQYGTIKPFIKASKDGRRVDVDFDYSLISSIYNEAIYEEYLYHRLMADIKTELISEELFFDLKMENTQAVLDADSAMGFDDFRDSDNTKNVFSLIAQPRWQKRISRNFVVNAYSWFGFDMYDPGREDTERRGLNISIGSFPDIQRLNWKLSGLYDRSHTRDHESSVFQKGILYVSYPLLNKLVAYADGGYERNHYQVASSEPWDEGSNWSAGFMWYPSRKTSLKISGGHREYGDIYSLDFSHIRKQSAFEITYAEELTSVSGIEVNPAVNAANYTGDISSLFRVVEDIFVQKTLIAKLGLRGARNTLSISVDKEVREYLSQTGAEKTYGAQFSWDLDLSFKSKFGINGKWQRLCESFDERLDDFYLISMRYDRVVGRGATTYFDLKRQVRDGKVGANEYQETVGTIGLELLY